MVTSGSLKSECGFSLLGTSGASLLELLGALAAGLVVLGAMLHSLLFFQREFSCYEGRVVQEQDYRLGMELLEQELHLAGSGSLIGVASDTIEFVANVHGYSTNLTALAAIGQTVLSVENGSGWPDRKILRVCWNDFCEQFTLAKTGQQNLLTLMEPVPRTIPAGASVTVMNRLRYYSRTDDHGSLRLLRQIDGGASVLIGDIKAVKFSYWNDLGRTTTHPGLVRRIIVEIEFRRSPMKAIREISLRT